MTDEPNPQSLTPTDPDAASGERPLAPGDVLEVDLLGWGKGRATVLPAAMAQDMAFSVDVALADRVSHDSTTRRLGAALQELGALLCAATPRGFKPKVTIEFEPEATPEDCQISFD